MNLHTLFSECYFVCEVMALFAQTVDEYNSRTMCTKGMAYYARVLITSVAVVSALLLAVLFVLVNYVDGYRH